jgi:preprotein translocase subunit Sec61beta
MAEIRKTSGKKGEGFQSAAGLIRYFDAEDDLAIKIPPMFVIMMCILTTTLVGLATLFIRV